MTAVMADIEGLISPWRGREGTRLLIVHVIDAARLRRIGGDLVEGALGEGRDAEERGEEQGQEPFHTSSVPARRMRDLTGAMGVRRSAPFRSRSSTRKTKSVTSIR